MRKRVIVHHRLILSLILFLILLLCVGCEQRVSPGNPFGDYDGQIDYEGNEDVPNYDEPKTSIEELCEYIPNTVFVTKGLTFEEALLQSQPNLRNLNGYNCSGGAKLIAEMSADVSGISSSYDNAQNRILKICPLNVLKLHIGHTSCCLFGRIVKRDVVLESCVIRSTPSIFDEHFEVSIIMTNNTSEHLEIAIEKGSMIESEANNVQNIVVTEYKEVTLPPRQKTSVIVRAFCASHYRSSPSGTKGRITPFVMNAPDNIYQTQQALWDYQAAPARNKITFYAWGKGADTGNGHVSSTGHAFVFIPRSGYWGYGSGDGNWIDGEGAVFDHSRQRQYATDSCSVYITDLQLSKVYDKLYSLRNKTPRYHIGLYDCTSFAMDIADAAEIHYGIRSFIQTPIGFMSQLKKYN